MNSQARCSNCVWCRPGGPHVGCYADGKWKKWIPKKEYDTPRDCSDFKPIRVLSNIEELFALQKQIMEKVPGGDCPEEMFHKITCGLGVIEETLEYLNSIGRKPWRPQPLAPIKQLEEIVDILHFFLELILRSRFTWEEIVFNYRIKHQENLERYEKGARGDYSWDDKGTKGEL